MVQKHMTLHKFRRQEDIDRWTHGSDASNGGLSTSNLELAMDGVGARFHGNMSLRVKPEYEGMYRGGFAGIKTRVSRIDRSHEWKLTLPPDQKELVRSDQRKLVCIQLFGTQSPSWPSTHHS